MLKNENHRPVQAEETKKRILQAAAEVFAEKSFHAATISEITNRAGVAKGTLYWYFPGKEELYRHDGRDLLHIAATRGED